MRDIITDIVRQSRSLFEILKVTGSKTETVFRASHKGNTLFFVAEANEPIEEFEGEFAIGSLDVLNGLLELGAYKGNEIEIGRKDRSGKNVVAEFVFKNAHGAGASYKTTSPDVAGKQAVIGNIPWDVSFIPDKAKVTEFISFADVCNNIDDNFGVKLVDDKIFHSVGMKSETTHSASIMFAENVDVIGRTDLGNLKFQTKQFLDVMKICSKLPTTIKISHRGVLAIMAETENAKFGYYLRVKD